MYTHLEKIKGLNHNNESINLDKHWELVNFCEFDKYATKSYCAIHNVDDSLNLGDITKVDETKLKPFNMICGGSPCQDFSAAGKQKGSIWTCKECGHEYNPLTVHWSKRDKCPQCNGRNIEKTRSSLLVEYLRVIRANKPNFGIYENVKNIVGKQFRDTTFKLFEDELHEYGYNTYWKVLNAKHYGIPQNRERVYLIFICKDLDNGKFKFPEPFNNGTRLRDILEEEVDEKFYLSDDKVQKFLQNLNQSDNLKGPIIAASRGRNPDNPSDRTIGLPTQQRLEVNKKGVSNTISTVQKDNLLIEPNSVKQIGNIVDTKNWNNPQTGRIYSTEGISPTLNTCGGGGHEPKIVTNKMIKIPQATKQGYVECEIGGVADLSYPNSKTRRRRVQESGKVSPTLTATQTGVCRIEKADGCYTNSSPGFTRHPLKGLSRTLKANVHDAGLYDGIRIRKLTPKECFRLMGFSDQDFDAAKNAGISNSQLYKQAGNSIVVDVLYYIYVELYKSMPYLFDDLRLSSFFSGIGAFEVALDRLYQGINQGNFLMPNRGNFLKPPMN